MNGYQSSFRAGLLDPAVAAPDRLRGACGGPAGRRYDVYRNNVTASLIDALTTAFPLVHKILGQQFFSQIAPFYVREHPAKSPLMMHYGADFPAFIEEFKPLSQNAYLADAARLDLAFRKSYHAADAATFDASTLADDPDNKTLTLSPSTIVLRSSWPLFEIWQYNFEDGAPVPGYEPQDVLISRPEFDPVVCALPPGGADWLDHISAGMTLSDALAATVLKHPAFDLTSALTTAITAQAFCGPTK